MKLIIAGGRNYLFTPEDRLRLNIISLSNQIEEVVSGGAKGADSCGEEWARFRLIPVKIFPADWNKHGKSAGPIRNAEMAEYADAVALFPGGRGTDSMAMIAKRYKLQIFDFRTPFST